MKKNSRHIENELSNWLSNANKIAIVGIGNELRQDDFIGMQVTRNLKGIVSSKKISIFECETVPENFIGAIGKIRPSHILVIDAAQIGLESGDFTPVGFERVRGLTISTHNLSLEIFANYLKKVTDAKIALLAIQPDKIEFNAGMSEKLKKTASVLTNILTKVLTNQFL